MEKYEIEKIRNIALFGHGDSGKTSLAEAMLFNAGEIKRVGKVDDGSTVSDFDPDEQKRGISVNATPLTFVWKDVKINLIDTPGFADFVGEVVATIRVVDSAVFVLSAVAGLEVQAEIIWKKPPPLATWPVPPQAEHRPGLVPRVQAVPLHSGHISWRVNSMVFSAPFAMSFSVNSTEVSKS